MTTDYQGPTPAPEPKPEKVIEKVISGEATTRAKPIGRKFKDIFFGGDFRQAARYVAGDVLLPALRNLIVDVTTKGMERVVYGDSGLRRRPTDYRPRTQYHNPFQRPSIIPADPRSRSYLPDQNLMRSQRKESNDIILATREEAELVLERLGDIIDQYEVASLADLYDLLGLPSSHVDNKWGWTVLNHVQIRQIREGFLIDLPQLETL